MAFAPLIAAATADPAALDLLPVSAGISGAIVAALRVHAGMSGGSAAPRGRWDWASTVVTGVLAAVWVGPAFAELAGVGERTRFGMLVHFLTGLLGATLCDLILSNRARIVKYLIGRVVPPAPSDEQDKGERK